MRRTVFQLERVEFRIERLQALHERGVGAGTLDGGVTTAQFFERFQRERSDVDQKLSQTRFVTKMFVRRNAEAALGAAAQRRLSAEYVGLPEA